MSVLERMYTYAKAIGAGARENFTTEALAGAISADAGPFVGLLQAAHHLPPGEVTDLQLDTQVVLPGTGVLDLVIQCFAGGTRRELWIEVKVLAGESGAQLDAYLAHISAIQEEVRPTLVTLARKPLRASDKIGFVSWHDLRRRAEASTSPVWIDFAAYLVEIRMSHDFDEAFTEREAAALDDFRLMHGKVARIIWEAASQARQKWPGLPWPTREEQIRAKTLERLGTHEQLVVGVPSANVARGVWLTLGVDLRQGDPALQLTVETWPSAFDTQRVIHESADASALPREWERHFGAWGGLRRRSLLMRHSDPADAIAWLVESIDVLGAAGILEIVERGRVSVGDVPANASIEA